MARYGHFTMPGRMRPYQALRARVDEVLGYVGMIERAGRAEQALQLAEDLAARRVVAEHQPGDRDHDQQQRCDREHRVVGERRAHALGLNEAAGS